MIESFLRVMRDDTKTRLQSHSAYRHKVVGFPLHGRPYYDVHSQCVIWQPQASMMTTNLDKSKGRDSALSALNVVIERLNPEKETSTIAPAKAV